MPSPRGGHLKIPLERSRGLLVLAYAIAAIAFWIEVVGGAWDIEWHLARRVEVFWTPPHIVLYSGIGLTFAACANGLLFGRGAPRPLRRGLEVATAGGMVQFAAGGFDSWWHATFGLDNALSPPHVLMIAGMNTVAIGLVLGFANLLSAPEFWRSVLGRGHALVRRTLPAAGAGWIFAILGLAWVFSHPGFDRTPLLGESWQRATVAFIFAAILPFTSIALRGLMKLRWTATAVLVLYGASLTAIVVEMGDATAMSWAALPLFAAAGFLVDSMFTARPTGAYQGIVAAATGAAIGLASLFLVHVPSGDMTGELSANPAGFLVFYVAGGLVGALLGLRIPGGLARRARAPRASPAAGPLR